MVMPQNFDRPGSSKGTPKEGTPRFSPSKGAVGSPLSHLRSPAARSPERLRSPLPGTMTTAEAEPVQVYEDPFTADGEPATGVDDKLVLGELPIDRANERQPSEEAVESLSQSTRSNEQNIDVQRTPRHHKTTSTGSVIAANGDSNAEVLRSRRLLASGIERIRAKTLDAHGFRRVQDIVKNGQDVWGDDGQKFGELLVVLLEYLESPNESLKTTGTGSASTKAQSLKGQVLAAIRAMLTLHRREAGAYYARSLCSVLNSRRQWDETMHITADIEKTADEIIKLCNPLDTLNAVLDLLENLSGGHPASPASSSSSERMGSPTPLVDAHRTSAFALQALGSLLSTAQSRNLPISQQMNQRLGACAVRFLQDPDSDVRKADLDFCLVMHGVDEEEFWRVLKRTGVKEGSVNLITYYIAKSRRGQVGA